GEQVLGFHVDCSPSGTTERQIDHPPPHIGAHGRWIVELQREEREDVAHAALLELAARPELVEDRCRLGVEADMPGPFRLVDPANGFYLDLQIAEMKNPCLYHPAQ